MNPGEKSWLRKTAELLSVMFHPILIPLFGLIIIYSSPTLLSFIPVQLKRLIFAVVVVNNVLIPLALAAILYARGAITTFNARDLNERVILLTFSLLMYTLTAYLLVRLQVSSLFRAYFISIAIVTLITLMITTFSRISLHAAGIGGLLVLIIYMIILNDISMVWQLISVIIVGAAVMSSRIYLEDHSPAEVWTGLLAGIAVMALSMFIVIK